MMLSSSRYRIEEIEKLVRQKRRDKRYVTTSSWKLDGQRVYNGLAFKFLDLGCPYNIYWFFFSF